MIILFIIVFIVVCMGGTYAFIMKNEHKHSYVSASSNKINSRKVQGAVRAMLGLYKTSLDVEEKRSIVNSKFSKF